MFYSFCISRLGDACYTLLDDGLANLFAVETLRHGTNPISYIGIRFFGGDPKKGGASYGATKDNSADNPKGNFYMLKDTEYDKALYSSGNWKNPFSIGFSKRLAPRLFTYLSGANFAKNISPNKAFEIVSGIFSLLFVPTIRFRFTQIDKKRIQEDPAYTDPQCGHTAYKTSQKVEFWRIGLLGTLLTGINFGLLSRARKHPSRVLTGVAQLTACVGITAIFSACMIAHPVPVIIGALLA